MANTPNPAREPLSGTSPIAGDVARMAERILAVGDWATYVSERLR